MHIYIWFRMIFIYALCTYEGYSKSSKTNSKKYFIYEIYKIIFLHSFHQIHNIAYRSDGNIAYKSVMNWMETM